MFARKAICASDKFRDRTSSPPFELAVFTVNWPAAPGIEKVKSFGFDQPL